MPLRGEEYSGRTVEEAIERGLHQLGRRRAEVDIEILERGKPANMLGLGGEDARVMLSFTEDLAEPEVETPSDEALVPRRPDAGRAAASLPTDAELEIAATVLAELLLKLKVQAEVELSEDPEDPGIEARGPELTALIGPGGENLLAIQQILSAIVSRRIGRPVHIPVDVAGYRHRREEQLRELALRIAARVRDSGQPVTLEPMLAYERRIVHLAVQDQPGIRTESVGMEPNRRIMIGPVGGRGPGPARPIGSGGFRPRSATPAYGPRRQSGPRPGGYRPR